MRWKLVKCIIRCKWKRERAGISEETKRVFPRRWVVLVTSRGCTGIEECSTADPYDPKEMDGTGEVGDEDKETDNLPPLPRPVS